MMNVKKKSYRKNGKKLDRPSTYIGAWSMLEIDTNKKINEINIPIIIDFLRMKEYH